MCGILLLEQQYYYIVSTTILHLITKRKISIVVILYEFQLMPNGSNVDPGSSRYHLSSTFALTCVTIISN